MKTFLLRMAAIGSGMFAFIGGIFFHMHTSGKIDSAAPQVVMIILSGLCVGTMLSQFDYTVPEKEEDD